MGWLSPYRPTYGALKNKDSYAYHESFLLSGGINPLIFNFNITRFTPWSSYTRSISWMYSLHERLCDHQNRLEDLEDRKILRVPRIEPRFLRLNPLVYPRLSLWKRGLVNGRWMKWIKNVVALRTGERGIRLLPSFLTYEEGSPLGRPLCRWEDDINMIRKWKYSEDVKWTVLAQK